MKQNVENLSSSSKKKATEKGAAQQAESSFVDGAAETNLDEFKKIRFRCGGEVPTIDDRID